MTDGFISLTAFAARVGVNRRTAMAWASQGRIRAHKSPGGHWRIAASEADNLAMTPAEFARATGYNHMTVRRWCVAGKVEATQTPGGHWLIPASQLDVVGRRER